MRLSLVAGLAAVAFVTSNAAHAATGAPQMRLRPPHLMGGGVPGHCGGMTERGALHGPWTMGGGVPGQCGGMQARGVLSAAETMGGGVPGQCGGMQVHRTRRSPETLGGGVPGKCNLALPVLRSTVQNP